jgi:hypothetical protein
VKLESRQPRAKGGTKLMIISTSEDKNPRNCLMSGLLFAINLMCSK